MKGFIFNIVIMAGLALGFVSYAQAQSGGVYRANIPFDFSVGTKQYTAGVYSIEVRGFEQRYFVLRDKDGKHQYAVKTTNVDPTKGLTAALDFQRVGDSYALLAIRAQDIMSTLPKPKVEDALAQGQTKQGTVTVALSKGR